MLVCEPGHLNTYVLVLLSVRQQGAADRKKAIAQDKQPPVNKQRLVPGQQRSRE